MPNLPTRSLATIVTNIAAGIQGRAKDLIDFSTGSTLLSIAEGFGSTGLWLQGLILKVLASTRASTSTGTDLDTWVADFGVSRLPARSATGNVTFSRITAGTSAPFIPLGAQVKTGDGASTFVVIQDAESAYFNALQGGYIMPSGVSAIDVLVQALTPGIAGNIVASAVSVLTTPITAIDNVTNGASFTNGLPSESDTALRARFISFIASLSQGTVAAIIYAVNSLQLGLQATVIENETPDGVSKPGFVWVTIDDGSGNPSQDLVDQASAAVGRTRAAGVMWGVFSPEIVNVSMAVTIVTQAGYDHNTAVAAVYAALYNYISSLQLGQSLPYSQLIVIAATASPGIVSVNINTLNGLSDTTVGLNQVIKPLTITVV